MSIAWYDPDDWPPPETMVGDFLRTDAGSCYRIDDYRPPREGSATFGRFICTRLEHDAVQFGQPGVWGWAWAKRERRNP